MTNHQIDKPKIFISHTHSDGMFVRTIQREIEKVFANGVSVFSTSSPGAIPAGKDWLQEIETKLSHAQAVIAIITPLSIERSWLWFEIGAVWSKSRTGDSKIYPLCAPEIDFNDLPSPLDRLQALSMGKAVDLKILFQELIKQFGFGNISSFKASNITKKIPKYYNVQISEIDLNERALYSGRFTGYSDKELMEVIDTELFLPDNEKYHELFSPKNREALIHNGKLLHFREIDRSLDLPPGTSKRLLVKVANRYGLIPVQHTDNIIRFKIE